MSLFFQIPRASCAIFSREEAHIFCKIFIICRAVCCTPSKQAVFPSLPLMCCFKMRFRHYFPVVLRRSKSDRKKEGIATPRFTKDRTAQLVICHICPRRLISASDSRCANYTARNSPVEFSSSVSNLHPRCIRPQPSRWLNKSMAFCYKHGGYRNGRAKAKKRQ